jgi:hypothetical protein
MRSESYWADNRVRVREMKVARRLAGLCQECGVAARVNATRCEGCRVEHVENMRCKRGAGVPCETKG